MISARATSSAIAGLPTVIAVLDTAISRELEIPDRVCYANIAASSAVMTVKSSRAMTVKVCHYRAILRVIIGLDPIISSVAGDSCAVARNWQSGAS